MSQASEPEAHRGYEIRLAYVAVFTRVTDSDFEWNVDLSYEQSVILLHFRMLKINLLTYFNTNYKVK